MRSLRHCLLRIGSFVVRRLQGSPTACVFFSFCFVLILYVLATFVLYYALVKMTAGAAQKSQSLFTSAV